MSYVKIGLGSKLPANAIFLGGGGMLLIEAKLPVSTKWLKVTSDIHINISSYNDVNKSQGGLRAIGFLVA